MTSQKSRQPEKLLMQPFGLPDRFGLRRPSLLGDTEEAKSWRARAVQSLIADLFQTAVVQLGKEEARRLFESVIKRKRGERGKGKNLPPETDVRLLTMYDAEVVRTPGRKKGSIPRRLAERLNREERGRFGASAAGIEKRIRGLLDERARLLAAIGEQIERWREADKAAFGKYIPSILGRAPQYESVFHSGQPSLPVSSRGL